MIYHLIKRVVKPLPNNRLQWECNCGLNIALPARPVEAGTQIQVADEKTGVEIVECAGCYAGVDEKGEAPVPVGAAANERDLNPTFDTDLGDAADDQTEGIANSGLETGNEVLKEESEEYPE